MLLTTNELIRCTISLQETGLDPTDILTQSIDITTCTTMDIVSGATQRKLRSGGASLKGAQNVCSECIYILIYILIKCLILCSALMLYPTPIISKIVLSTKVSYIFRFI